MQEMVGKTVKIGYPGIRYAGILGDFNALATGVVREYVGEFKEDPNGDYDSDPQYKVEVTAFISEDEFRHNFRAGVGDTITTLGCNLEEVVMATCCCCGTTKPFDEVCDVWHPGVFDKDEFLGDMCDACVAQVGLRDSAKGEQFHNDRIVSRDVYDRIKKNQSP